MKCDRCGFENYDEAYACRSCGAKLSKSKRNTNSYTSPQSDFSFNSQQRDNYQYQNNQQHDNYQYHTNRYHDNYQYQNDKSQYDNYHRQTNQQYHAQQTPHDSGMQDFSDIPADGRVHTRHFTHTDANGNRTEKVVYATRRKVSSPFETPRSDSEVYQMFQNAKRTAENQQYNTTYSNYSPYSNNSAYSNNTSYSTSYNQPHSPSRYKTRYKNKNSMHKLVTVVAVIFMLSITALIAYSLWSTIEESSDLSDYPPPKQSYSSTEPNSLDHSLEYSSKRLQVVDTIDQSLCVEVAIPDTYKTKTEPSDRSTAKIQKYSDSYDPELLVDASISIISDDTRTNIDIMKELYKNNGLQEFSEETVEVDLGTLTIFSVFVNDEVFYFGFIDLDDEHCLRISTSCTEGNSEYKNESKELLLLLAETAKFSEFNKDY